MFVKRFFLAAAAALAVGHAVAQEVVLAVNEGVTYQEGGGVHERYRPLADLLSRELKRPVKVLDVSKYTVLEKGLAEEKYDLAFIHPAHIGLQAVKSGKYQGLCSAKGYTDYRARVLVAKDSPLKSIQDLQGKKIGVPSLESITTVMFIAHLKQLNFTQPEKNFTATRYQDAVPFMVEKQFVVAGVTGSAAVEKEWTSKGGKVLGETKPVPVKQFIASRKLPEADRARVEALMLGLSGTDAGRAALERIGMKGFVPWDAAIMAESTSRLGIK
jgi:phosphonate transport system substrate-binding protein